MALTQTRGQGLVYRGSLVEFRGLAVVVLDDCECSRCERLEPWDGARRYRVVLQGGVVLECARPSSFDRP